VNVVKARNKEGFLAIGFVNKSRISLQQLQRAQTLRTAPQALSLAINPIQRSEREFIDEYENEANIHRGSAIAGVCRYYLLRIRTNTNTCAGHNP
jgi:hypothetical protein